MCNDSLRFDPEAYVSKIYSFEGREIRCRAWENIPYCTRPEAPQLQVLNLYVPEDMADDKESAIYFMQRTGGMGEEPAACPETDSDRSGILRALSRGYVAASPGARGRETTADGIYVGRGEIPATIIDLKAAIAYLHYNKGLVPGNPDKIIEEGCSSGGGMSALLGATGNSARYRKYLDEIGAADANDDIYCAIVNSPITDFEHIDIAYEWLFSPDNVDGLYAQAPEDAEISRRMAARYEEYVDSLGLKNPDTGEAIGFRNGDTYTPYLLKLLGESATVYLSSLSQEERTAWLAEEHNKDVVTWDGSRAEITNLHRYIMWNTGRWMKYLGCYDGMDEKPSRENEAFGTRDGKTSHFSRTFGELLAAAPGRGAAAEKWLAEAEKKAAAVYLLNPFNFIGTDEAVTTAPHWLLFCGGYRETTGNDFLNLVLLLRTRYPQLDVSARFVWNHRHTMISALIPEETYTFLDQIR